MNIPINNLASSENSIIGVGSTVGGNDKYLYSANGFNWEYKTFPKIGSAWQGIVYGSDKYVIIDNSEVNNILISNSSGLNWQMYTFPGMTPSNVLNNISFANNKFYLDSSMSNNQFYYSSDAINWSTGTLPISSKLRKVIYAENLDMYVALLEEYTRTYLYSNNGLNWNTGIFPVSGNLYDIVYDNNKFILLPNWGFQNMTSNTGYVSLDGLNWSPLLFPSNNYSYIVYNKTNNLYLIASERRTGIAISNNGFQWTVTGDVNLLENYIIEYKDKFVQVATRSYGTPNEIYVYSKLPYNFEFKESGNLYSPPSNWSNGIGNANIGNWFFVDRAGTFRGIINTNQNGRTSIGNSGFFFAPSTGSSAFYVDGYFNLINPLINGQGISLNANYSWNGGMRGIEFKPETEGNSLFRIEHGNADDRIFLRGSGISDQVILSNGFQQALTYNIVYQKTGILFEARNYSNNNLIYSTGLPFTQSIRQVHFYVGNILTNSSNQLNYGLGVNNLGLNYKEKVPF